VDDRFKQHIRVGAVAIIWSLWLYRNDKVFSNRTISLAGYLPVYWYSPFVVISTEGGASRPIFGGLFTVGGYNDGYFFPSWVAA
jgi:hypothetical protein